MKPTTSSACRCSAVMAERASRFYRSPGIETTRSRPSSVKKSPTPRISRTRAHFFVGRRRGVCGPSSSGAEIVQRSDSSSDEHDAVGSILPPLPPAAVSLCGGGGEEGVAVTFPPQQPPLLQELETPPIHGEVRLRQHIWEQHRNEGFSTHQPALIHYVRATARPGAGDIWEFGGGTGSTPLLRQLAEHSRDSSSPLRTRRDSSRFGVVVPAQSLPLNPAASLVGGSLIYLVTYSTNHSLICTFARSHMISG